MAEVIATQDAVILVVVLGGRSVLERGAVATFITGDEWHPRCSRMANATAITGDLVDFVRDLKSQPGGDIGIHASISVTQALLAAGVVDELGLVIAPRIVGTGKRLLDGLPPIQLELIRTERSPNGHLLAAYRVTH